MKKSKDTSKQSSRNKKTSAKTEVFLLQKPTPQSANKFTEEDILETDGPKAADAYESRYIAFIDILGFKEIIRSSRSANNSTGPWSISAIYNALNLNYEGYERDYYKAHKLKFDKKISDLRVTTFSDFVVISAPSNPVGLDVLIFVVWSVVRDWLSKGYLSRGGIAKGDVVHQRPSEKEPGLVFGPAFIEAYILEQEVADYPRVVFSKNVRTDLNKYELDTSKGYQAIRKLVKICDDGPRCIDTFGHLRKNGFDFLGTQHLIEASQFNETLKNQLEHGADTPKWYRKTKWLVEQFNHAIYCTDYAGKTLDLGGSKLRD